MILKTMQTGQQKTYEIGRGKYSLSINNMRCYVRVYVLLSTHIC